MRSGDILHQAKGGSSWSRRLRSDGSQDGQAGEADPVEPKLGGGQESQTRVNRTVNGTAVKAVRREASGLNKGLLSCNIYLKERAGQQF